MESKPYVYGNFVVYPEYCGLEVFELAERSLSDERYHVAALPKLARNIGIALYKGDVVWSRPKYRLHASEVGMTRGRSPSIVVLGGTRVLVLICYEICFPRDYLHRDLVVDLVIHMIGQPMFDENQREGWVALQEMLTYWYNCPLVCCCGGEEGRMNLTGVIDEPSKQRNTTI